MKKILLAQLALLVTYISFSQEYKNVSNTERKDIHLADSVIYFDNKPVAYYYVNLNESNPHYNIRIKSLNMNLLIDAQVVKFDAPVEELKPFYYYNLIFKNERDTLAIYHYGQAFMVELATLLKDYRLLEENRISRYSLRKFKREYSGTAALVAKIKEFETYLNESRFFNEQTTRDRTKPVTIKNDRIIMQDGKKIGLLVPANDSRGGGATTTYRQVTNADGKISAVSEIKDRGTTAGKDYVQVQLPSDRIVDASKINLGPRDKKNKLYEISLPLNKESRNDGLLLYICQLVENYLL